VAVLFCSTQPNIDSATTAVVNVKVGLYMDMLRNVEEIRGYAAGSFDWFGLIVSK
jgi:hypothetical protein